METLGFNLFHWSTSTVPWGGQTDQETQKMKMKLMDVLDLGFSLFSSQRLGIRTSKSCLKMVIIYVRTFFQV